MRAPRLGLAARSTLLLGLVVLATAGAAALAARLSSPPAVVLLASAAVGLLLGLWGLDRGLGAVRRSLDALTDGVRSFRDADFSMRLAVTRRDELGDLLRLYNEMGDALRAERHDLFQRELLLDTVLQGAPMALVLEDRRGRVLYANRAARDLLAGGRRLEGRLLEEVLAACGPEVREALEAPADTLFTVGQDGEEETYRAARRSFQLNMQPHVLHLVERLTPELRRQEVEVWKKAIRVMNHEMNNSLAPIRSLVHSARQAVERPEHAHRLEGIFETIEERATHLAAFLEEYARFARLPRPRLEAVRWDEFLAGVRAVCPFRLEGAAPEGAGWFDAAQMQQVLINLLKNAYESGSPPDEVALTVLATIQGEVAVRVLDRGRGMEPEVMERALLPFYSSKASGTGLGLALCKEIVEAHGGRVRLQNRPGGGLAVTAWLPAAALGSVDRAAVPAYPAAPEPPA
jgi:nitrogen fixation/metabolism regulation signal transduction histidine kinase